MKHYKAKQSGSEVILEEVNPYLPMLKHSGKAFTPLILTSIDPQIKVGDLIREDQLEPDQWQCEHLIHGWIDTKYKSENSLVVKSRQVAKLKINASEDKR